MKNAEEHIMGNTENIIKFLEIVEKDSHSKLFGVLNTEAPSINGLPWVVAQYSMDKGFYDRGANITEALMDTIILLLNNGATLPPAEGKNSRLELLNFDTGSYVTATVKSDKTITISKVVNPCKRFKNKAKQSPLREPSMVNMWGHPVISADDYIKLLDTACWLKSRNSSAEGTTSKGVNYYMRGAAIWELDNVSPLGRKFVMHEDSDGCMAVGVEDVYKKVHTLDKLEVM